MGVADPNAGSGISDPVGAVAMGIALGAVIIGSLGTYACRRVVSYLRCRCCESCKALVAQQISHYPVLVRFFESFP